VKCGWLRGPGAFPRHHPQEIADDEVGAGRNEVVDLVVLDQEGGTGSKSISQPAIQRKRGQAE
jgi:hypothetical protein